MSLYGPHKLAAKGRNKTKENVFEKGKKQGKQGIYILFSISRLLKFTVSLSLTL